jgi:hypothetical protein
VLKRGGKLLVVDLDWDALTITHVDKIRTRKIVEFLSDSFPNGRIGANLPGHFKSFGFTDFKIKTIGYHTHIEFLKRVIGGTILTGIEKGVFTESEINKWWKFLEIENDKGAFFCSFNGFMAMGTK